MVLASWKKIIPFLFQFLNSYSKFLAFVSLFSFPLHFCESFYTIYFIILFSLPHLHIHPTSSSLSVSSVCGAGRMCMWRNNKTQEKKIKQTVKVKRKISNQTKKYKHRIRVHIVQLCLSMWPVWGMDDMVHLWFYTIIEHENIVLNVCLALFVLKVTDLKCLWNYSKNILIDFFKKTKT